MMTMTIRMEMQCNDGAAFGGDDDGGDDDDGAADGGDDYMRPFFSRLQEEVGLLWFATMATHQISLF